MTGLPTPTFVFTLPSQADNTTISCRIYHPLCLSPNKLSHVVPYQRRAAIVAHPYATLGGCQDDPVVQLIAEVCLAQGWVVGTFDFRGAGCSGGRTSWQGKGEMNDYQSFVAFMTYYLHHLKSASLPLALSQWNTDDLTPVPSQVLPPPTQTHSSRNKTYSLALQAVPTPKPLLLLAGYSYGALITASLPPSISTILQPYQTPAIGSTYYSIRLRAHSLAIQQNNKMDGQVESLVRAAPRHRARSLDALSNHKVRGVTAVRAGGDEDLHRISHETHRRISVEMLRSTSAVRKSVDKVRNMASPRRVESYKEPLSKHDSHKAIHPGLLPSEVKPKDEHLVPIEGIEMELSMAYLLVSPLLGLVSHLVTCWSKQFYTGRTMQEAQGEPEIKLAMEPTLVIYGDKDIFVSVKRLRAWVNKLERLNSGMLRAIEVEGADHFWHKTTDLVILREHVTALVYNL